MINDELYDFKDPSVFSSFNRKILIINKLIHHSSHTTGHDSQRTVFRFAQKACGKGFFGEKLLFLIKIFNFHQKQQILSDRFFKCPNSMS